MTLLPEVRRQLSQAAERQASARKTGGRALSLGVHRLRRRPSISFAHLALATSVVVVAAVAAAFLASGGSAPTGSPAAAVVRVVFRAHPIRQTPLSQPALARAVTVLRQRLGSSFHDFSVTRSPNLGLTVVVRHAAAGDRARILALSRSAQLYFYDWEANALAVNGKRVASQLVAQSQNATLISQGSGNSSPGSASAGSLPLYAAVRLASKQKNPPIGPFNSRLGPLYYRFGASGSAACAIAGKFYGFTPVAGQRCLISGPEPTIQELNTGIPPGTKATSGQVLSVPQGIVVLQAVPESLADPSKLTDPSSRFFVLTDHLALLGSDITNPKQGTDASGSPDVAFGFNSRGNRQFEAVTGQIAKRGAADSGLGRQLDQHFGIALDTQLITVPSIDFRQYPDGVRGGGGAEISGSFTIRSARDLATQLRFGPLPVQLTPTS